MKENIVKYKQICWILLMRKNIGVAKKDVEKQRQNTKFGFCLCDQSKQKKSIQVAK